MGPNKKWQQGFLSSIYYLDDFKSYCHDYTKEYASFTLAGAVNAVVIFRKQLLQVHYVYWHLSMTRLHFSGR